MQNIFKHKGIIIGIVIFVLAFIAYSFYISGKKTDSTVTKQAVTQTSASNSAKAAGPGQEFVAQLLAIQNINLNLDFFNDPVFLGLQDFSHELTPQPSGRQNPFSPLNLSELSGGSQTTVSGGITGGVSDANTQTGLSGAVQTNSTVKAPTATGATGGAKLPPRPAGATGTGTKQPLFKPAN